MWDTGVKQQTTAKLGSSATQKQQMAGTRYLRFAQIHLLAKLYQKIVWIHQIVYELLTVKGTRLRREGKYHISINGIREEKKTNVEAMSFKNDKMHELDIPHNNR